MSSSQRDVEREWREKQQVKESRSQSGQKGMGFGGTSGNGPGTGILGVGWRRSRNPGMQGKDFVLPSRNSSFPSCIPNKNLDTAEARPHFSCSRQLPPFPNPLWSPLPISLRCKIPKTATWDGSPHSFGLFFGKNQDWDPPSRLLALWDCQIQPRERFREFLIPGGQEPGMKNGILGLWSQLTFCSERCSSK